MEYYYIYKIILTAPGYKGYYYIGSHGTNNLNDNYKGSGKLLKEYYKKFPYDYIKGIICFCDSKRECCDEELKYINLYIDDDKCLNIKKQGRIIDTHSKETKQKMSSSAKGKIISDEQKEKISNTLKDYYKYNNSPMKGKHLSDDAIEKLRQANLGKKQSDETKRKRGEKLKGHIGFNKGMKWYTNGIINKLCREDEIPEGFFKGKVQRNNTDYYNNYISRMRDTEDDTTGDNKEGYINGI